MWHGEVPARVAELAHPLAAHHATRWRKGDASSPTPTALVKVLKVARNRIDDDGEHHLDFQPLSSFENRSPSVWVKGGAIVDARLERPVARNGRLIGGFDTAKLILPLGHHAPRPVLASKKKSKRKKPVKRPAKIR